MSSTTLVVCVLLTWLLCCASSQHPLELISQGVYVVSMNRYRVTIMIAYTSWSECTQKQKNACHYYCFFLFVDMCVCVCVFEDLMSIASMPPWTFFSSSPVIINVFVVVIVVVVGWRRSIVRRRCRQQIQWRWISSDQLKCSFAARSLICSFEFRWWLCMILSYMRIVDGVLFVIFFRR